MANVNVQGINDAFIEALHAGTRNLCARNTAETALAACEKLLEAVLTGNYQSFADEAMEAFWNSVAEGMVPTAELKVYFAALVEQVPALKNPLRIAYNKLNPYKVLEEVGTVDNVGS